MRRTAYCAGVMCLWLACAAGARGEDDVGFPCWRGAYGTGVGVECGEPMVDDTKQARLVWESEETFPHVYKNARHGGKQMICSHYCMPVVADGRVFYVWPRPTGPLDPAWDAREAEQPCRLLE